MRPVDDDFVGVREAGASGEVANRQALLEALAVSAKQRLLDAIGEVRPNSAPALVTLYRVTANVLRVKNTWRSTLSHATAHTETAAALWAEIDRYTVELLTSARSEGILAPDADLDWTRQVYYALLSEALDRPGADRDPAAQDPDAPAALVINTLLHGAGPRGRAPTGRWTGNPPRAGSRPLRAGATQCRPGAFSGRAAESGTAATARLRALPHPSL
ncbi:TetR/AcrR family transcriptional regulator [Streptomyces sp. ALI-76-A]|uniref:TetR/AcrR family transcriptional regulator n=1 Tax=Streptomyces sp. ALI-76-A TaxID=3025736 RepID=UPI00256EB5C4|nr:TetR/AcrR family transcriptional regulator [Streptomyces sp. ALI-76-A]MDL5201441.1 TetR/AcrR family transcriptional regulator [Streptomyces sp. ALI-76-A]